MMNENLFKPGNQIRNMPGRLIAYRTKKASSFYNREQKMEACKLFVSKNIAHRPL